MILAVMHQIVHLLIRQKYFVIQVIQAVLANIDLSQFEKQIVLLLYKLQHTKYNDIWAEEKEKQIEKGSNNNTLLSRILLLFYLLVFLYICFEFTQQ